MIRFKSKIDNYIFEAIENSIHYNILIKNDEFEIIEEVEAEETEEAKEEKKINYANMKVDELKELANEKGIDFDSKITKAELIEELEKLG